MMNSLFKVTAVCLMLISSVSVAQETKTKNVIVVTLDGYRWKEVFKGADPRILHIPKYVKDTAVWNQFGDHSQLASREKLMPFFWNVIGTQGQLYGNRKYKNKVNCSNGHLISYPGYSELLVGFAEPKVSSNRKKENPNYTVLEYIGQQDGYEGQVAAFATWDAFPFILREEKSKIPVNAGVDIAEGKISEREKWLNENQIVNKNPHGSRYDEYTFGFAMEYLNRERPNLLFIGFDETDEHGHGGRYDEYLKSANHADQMLQELWQWVQSQPDYKDQTTLLITTDHGRGNGKNIWRNHRIMAQGSRHVWFAVIGPDTPAFGEMKFNGKYYQKQAAKTIAAFLGINYKQRQPVGEVVQTMLAVPALPTGESITAENSSTSPDVNQNDN